jgi:hypothetical protein
MFFFSEIWFWVGDSLKSERPTDVPFLEIRVAHMGAVCTAPLVAPEKNNTQQGSRFRVSFSDPPKGSPGSTRPEHVPLISDGGDGYQKIKRR